MNTWNTSLLQDAPNGVTCKNNSAEAGKMDGPFFDDGTIIVSSLTSVICITTLALLVCLHFRGKGEGNASLWTRAGSWPCIRIWATFVFRCTVFVFCISVEFYQVGGFGLTVFEAYTVWNFVLIIALFGLGAAIDACHLVTICKTGSAELTPTLRKLSHLHYILVEIELPSSVLVCAVVWGVLVWVCPLLTFTSYIQHAFNVVFMVTEFVISGMALNIQHILLVCAWALSYAVFHLIFHAFTGANVYPFMATQRIDSAFWYVGLLVVHALIFLAFWGIGRCKEKCCSCLKVHSDYDNFYDGLDSAKQRDQESHPDYGSLEDGPQTVDQTSTTYMAEQ